MKALTGRTVMFLAAASIAAMVASILVLGSGHNVFAQIQPSQISSESKPLGIAIDPTRNKVYVANSGASTITVINGSNRVERTIPTQFQPYEVTVDTNSNTLYVTHLANNVISVLDLNTGSTTKTISVGMSPLGIAVNPVSHKVYVADRFENTVSVIDTTSNSVIKTIQVGRYPHAIAVNDQTNKVYVTIVDVINNGKVTVIDGNTDTVITNIPVGRAPTGIAINQDTSTIYVTTLTDDTLYIIDANTNMVKDTITPNTNSLMADVAVDVGRNKVFFSFIGSNVVVVLDGGTKVIEAEIQTGDNPARLAYNPTSGKIYTANYMGGTVTAIQRSK